MEVPDFAVLGSIPDSVCGTVKISGEIGASGLRIGFAFKPADPLPEGCCQAYGWIQHECSRGGWRFDNGTHGGLMPMGATSDPSRNPQGSSNGERWDPNPWYGGTGNVKEARARTIRKTLPKDEQEDALDRLNQDFERNPVPQTEIQDQPGGNCGFVTQLVCVESGKVVFQYRWVIVQQRDNLQWQFVGGQGDNLTIYP